ncbi:DUF2628 domain-containing protein [Methylomonas sp. AM2-LC]|uniref:DUF2628 domain-containing protein n=1 Tax=Methylomonas sp. AM2-LC TaxID=3153301 RepID=UPI003264C879
MYLKTVILRFLIVTVTSTLSFILTAALIIDFSGARLPYQYTDSLLVYCIILAMIALIMLQIMGVYWAHNKKFHKDLPNICALVLCLSLMPSLFVMLENILPIIYLIPSIIILTHLDNYNKECPSQIKQNKISRVRNEYQSEIESYKTRGYESIEQEMFNGVNLDKGEQKFKGGNLGEDFELYEAIIGPKNQNYYLSLFSSFYHSEKTWVTWNWAAFFFTFYWLIYRKMWFEALQYGILYVVSLIISGIFHWQILLIILTFIIPTLYSESVYYRHCQSKISKIKSISLDRTEQVVWLCKIGGRSHFILPLVMTLLFFGVLSRCFSIAGAQL